MPPVPADDESISPTFANHTFRESISLICWRGKLNLVDARAARVSGSWRFGPTPLNRGVRWSGGWGLNPFGFVDGNAEALGWIVGSDPSVLLNDAGTRRLMIPLWPVPLGCGVVVGGWAVPHWVRRRRQAAGRCRHCNYDLRASPDRCPECGTIHDPVTPRLPPG